jgi:GT2 family glycosyltransferase
MTTLTHVIALISCHNRREATLACLSSLSQQADSACRIEAVLVDDGSTDRTAESVESAFGDFVAVVRGDGRLYWAGGMALAELHARRGEPDFLLWLNDDVELTSTAVKELIEVADASTRSAVVVGAVADPDSATLTYSGLRRRDWHPMRYDRIAPNGSSIDVDTFNGNVVLVPRAVYESLGPIDAGLVHTAADIDYGLRVKRAGLRNVLAPRVVGVCTGNARREATSIPRLRRWEAFIGPKGVPPKPYARFLRRHGGPLWPVFWCATYLKAAGLVALGRSPYVEPVLETQRTDRLARRTGGHDVRRNIAGDHASRTDDASAADRDAFEDDRARTDEDVVLDNDGIGSSRRGKAVEAPRHLVDHVEVGVGDHDVGPHEHALPDRDAHRSADRRSAEAAVCADVDLGGRGERPQDHRPRDAQCRVAAGRDERDAFAEFDPRAGLAVNDRTAQHRHVRTHDHATQAHREQPYAREKPTSSDGCDAVRDSDDRHGGGASSLTQRRSERDVA